MCVHTTHCCRIHGCKYCDVDCPVYLGFTAQKLSCELCGKDISYDDIPKVNFEEFKKRREYANGLRMF